LRAVLRRLADAEDEAATARISACRTSGAELARLLASVGGCEAAHAALLRSLPGPPG
jgi:hypothetical protein